MKLCQNVCIYQILIAVDQLLFRKVILIYIITSGTGRMPAHFPTASHQPWELPIFKNFCLIDRYLKSKSLFWLTSLVISEVEGPTICLLEFTFLLCQLEAMRKRITYSSHLPILLFLLMCRSSYWILLIRCLPFCWFFFSRFIVFLTTLFMASLLYRTFKFGYNINVCWSFV